MTRFERRWSELPTPTIFENVLDMSQKNRKSDYIDQEDRRIALKEFRKVCQDILQPHHDEEFLLRWLRARDYDVVKSERMIRESFKFRKKMGSDTILSTYELPEVYKKFPITHCLGFDKENSVVRLFMAGICDYKGFVYSFRVVDLMKLLIYFLEHDLKMMQEKKKKNASLEEKSTFILDFNGFNLKQFYDKSVINAGIQLITMYQDNYPETLKAAYLINVPSYFSWIFNLFKPFLNSVTLSKIRIYKTDEWKEELFSMIDKAQVPAFMGGDLTDPDGNPKCHTMINWDSKIPTSYYLKQNRQMGGENDPTMKSVTIQQRSNFEVPVDVKDPGSILKWVFRTKDYNVKFGLFFRHKKNQMEELIPVESVDCQLLPEENEFICEKAGTYVLHFDNSYSWLTTKHLWYKVDIEAPEFDETNNN